MAYRIIMVQETGEEICHRSDIDTMESAMDALDSAYDQHPECRFWIEPEIVGIFDTDEEFEDVPW